MQLDIALPNGSYPVLLARGPPFSVPASGVSNTETHETHSGDGPWTAEGISRATWYRRSRPSPVRDSEPPVDRMRWYVARALFGQGEEADWEIRTAGFDVVTARMQKPATRAHRTPTGRLMPATEQSFPLLFVRYVIVRFCFPGPALSRIVNLDSVERVISGGHLTNHGIGIPISIPDKSIDSLRRLLHSDGCYYPPGHMYSRADEDNDLGLVFGSAVTVRGGPLADRKAVYDMSDGQRAGLLVSMFNRDNVRANVAQSAVGAN
jgi:transcription antitermination factor NusG